MKAGEFLLGYPDELGGLPPMPTPEVLGRNGTYAVLRKVHQRVAAFRQFLKASSANPEEEEWLAAKMMGRCRSGAPLALSPEKDDPGLGADPTRNNAFLYRDDPKGYRTPPGSHIRRANPRDALGGGDTVRIHRVLRRRTSYGPPLPEGALEDDGADRGQVFLFIGAHLRRQFEFVQSIWINGGEFIGAGADRDPIASTGEGGRRLHHPALAGARAYCCHRLLRDILSACASLRRPSPPSLSCSRSPRRRSLRRP
ncbi:hypothetical protein WMF16_13760 [Sorangium sp. So ce388]